MKFWPFLSPGKKIHQFVLGWFGNSVFAQTIHGPSVSQNQTAVKVFFVQAICLLDKTNQHNLKIIPLSHAGKKFTDFLGSWFENHDSVFAQTCHGHSVSQDETPLKIFGSGNLSFRQNKPIKFENLILLACSKEIQQFVLGWCRNNDSVSAKSFHDPILSQNETPVKFFGSSNLPFQQKKPIKFEISNPFTCWKKTHQFVLGQFGNYNIVSAQTFLSPSLETTAQFLPKLSMVLQCHKMKLMWKFFCSSNLPFRQSRPTKFENSTLLTCWKEIHRFFLGWFENHNSVFAQTCHGPSVSQNETLWKFLVQAIYLLDKILTLSSAGKKFNNFLGAYLETTIQFLPKLFMALQCHKIQLLWKFMFQAICLLDKTNQ